MWRCVDLALTDVSEECIASIFGLEKIRERGTSGRSTEFSTIDRTSVSPKIIRTRSLSYPMWGLFLTELPECCPDTSDQWACLSRKYLVSSSQSKIT
jgi:hypothetical protein